MSQPETPVGFDEQNAANYDDRFAKISALRDALLLQTRAILGDLPVNARVLCVGAGTGHEVLALATHFPGWQFTVVEPSAPMMGLCRRRAAEHGFAPRCTFHTGYLDTLPPSEPFHAATSLLVSHFLVKPEARRAFFREIAARLRPQGWLVTADLSGDRTTTHHAQLQTAWLRLMEIAGIAPEQHAQMLQAWQENVSFLPVAEFEALLASAGFEAPVLFHQSLLIRAWFAQRRT
jgi:tRNA (cmo5U34)-methyltransferase